MFGKKVTATQGRIEQAIEAFAKELIGNRQMESRDKVTVKLSYEDACYLCANGLLNTHLVTRTGEVHFTHPSFNIEIKD